MRQSFTITLQNNQGNSARAAFEVSPLKAQKIIDMLHPEIKKAKKKRECSSVKLDSFFS
jgi:hypothetical protein|tara:strand:+ start:1104 stop:1280 length:177 start_codon:yes stop_codon:yes gene_type:complete